MTCMGVLKMIKKPKMDEMTDQGKQHHVDPFAHFIISKKSLLVGPW